MFNFCCGHITITIIVIIIIIIVIIIVVVVQAMGATWHPECFCCEMCHKELADLGFVKNQGRALCHECNAKVRSSAGPCWT